MQAYISISFSRRSLFQDEIRVIAGALEHFGMEAFVFVDHYRFDKTDERQMMQQAFDDIDQSALLIAETSDKAIGIGVEVGYAKAKHKPIVYLRKSSAEHSTTVAGASDYQVVYEHSDDLQLQLKAVLEIIAGYRYK